MSHHHGLRIVLATDGSADAAAAVSLISALALRPADEITVIAVVPPMPVLGAELEPPHGTAAPSLSDAARLIVEETAAQLRQRGMTARPETRIGNPAEEILVCAEETHADLIALGAKGVGKVRRFLLGSVAQQVARYATCSVLAAREPGMLRSLLVATDCSPHAEAAVTALLSLPLPQGLTATAVTVVSPESGNEEAARTCAQAVGERLRQNGLMATWESASGNEAATILSLAEAKQSDLIVLGAGQRAADSEPILGSIAFGVLDGASCSVFLGRGQAR